MAADEEDTEMFAFMCTSDYAAVAETLQLPKSKLGTCCYDFDRFRLYSRDRIQSVSDNAQASVQGAS